VSEHSVDSDRESALSFGAEADAQLEMPIIAAHNLLGRLVRAVSLLPYIEQYRACLETSILVT